MKKLDPIMIEKKISEIYLAKEYDSRCTAWMEHDIHPDVMFINLNGVFARWERFWEAWSDVIITHESVHAVIYRLEGKQATKAVDNLWTTTLKSVFLVDCDPKWFKWKEFKR